jgi:hypothetical protein
MAIVKEVREELGVREEKVIGKCKEDAPSLSFMSS